MKKSIFRITAPGLIGVLVLAGCSRKPAVHAKPEVPALVAKSFSTNVPVLVSAIGNVMPYSRVTIRSQITGQLLAVNFREGGAVKQGDLLFTLDARPPQAALLQAQANLARDTAQLENTRIEFDRSQKLFNDKILSQSDYDTARAAMDGAQGTVAADAAAVTNATLNLDYTAIRSPIDGIAGAQLMFPGNVVKSPDDEMLIINQIHPIYVLFAVPERYLTEIRREMNDHPLKVGATFTGLQGRPPEGLLTFVDNNVDMTTGTIQLKATFTNETSVLWPGQFVQVSLTLSEISNAVVVPSQAVQTGQDGDYVFVVGQDQIVRMQAIKTGDTLNGLTLVTEGLKAGETVVTDGQLRLVDGARIDTKAASGSEAKTNSVAAQP